MIPPLVKKIIETNRKTLDELFSCKNGAIYTFLNPVSYINALKYPQLFHSYDGIFADGSLLTKAINSLYDTQIIRRSFDMTSLVPPLLEFAKKHNKSIYIVASEQQKIDDALKMFHLHYPNIDVAGRNGYFTSEADMNKEISHIIELSPDILVVGMGAIYQENFLIKVKNAGYNGIGFSCGGFIHQSTMNNKLNYYPNWVDRYDLRFLYRFFKEKHTRKRYLKAAFVFPIKFLQEYFKYKHIG